MQSNASQAAGCTAALNLLSRDFQSGMLSVSDIRVAPAGNEYISAE